METHSKEINSDQSPTDAASGEDVNSITSFLHKLRHMPANKQQQLVSTSAAIVRNNNNIDENGDGDIQQNENAISTSHEINDLNREKVFEVVYGAVKGDRNANKASEQQPQCQCFVVDAHERRVRIVSKNDQKKQNKLIHLEDIPENEIARFGEVFPDERIDENVDCFVHCDQCNKYYDFCCLEHPLYQCQDREAFNAPNSPTKEGEDRAALTLPGFLYIHNSYIPNAGKGVFAKVDIPIGIVFGPYEGVLLNDAKKASQDGYAWELRAGNGKPSCYIDAKDPRYSNWMRYINSPRHEGEQNLIAFQFLGSIFYRVYRPIDKNTELLVWYGKKFAKELGIISCSKPAIKKKPFIFYPRKNPFVL